MHDHERQGVLELERQWLTRDWWVRTFTTIFAVIVVNSIYFAARLEYRQDFMNAQREPMPEFLDYAGRLAHSLIFNPFASVPAAGIRRDRHGNPVDDDGMQVEIEVCSNYLIM